LRKDQVDRMNKINELIRVIADTDRKFFYSDSKGSISKFVEGNKLFFIDKYTDKKIYPYQLSKRKGFSEGGTLWGLINDFREWIITGSSRMAIMAMEDYIVQAGDIPLMVWIR